MSEKNSNNIIAIDGGKKKSATSENNFAKLIVEGQEIDLESFILSGCNSEGRRVLLTWQVSIDELCSYNTVLNVVVEDKIRETLSSE